MESTPKQVTIKQVKLFLKVYKTFVIPYVPVGKVILNFCLSVYLNRDAESAK